MYVPKHNEIKDISAMHSLIESHPLGAWVTVTDGILAANHIPFMIRIENDGFGTLVGHVARANTVWQDFNKEQDSMVIFQGDQAYMSPSWYPSKHEHGKGVPTWCYMVVHAHGMPVIHEDPEWLLQFVNELTDVHESKQDEPWKVSDAPDDFINMLLGAIVGIEIPITMLTGKWKLDQNRTESDRAGVIDALTSTNEPESQRMAEHIRNQTK